MKILWQEVQTRSINVIWDVDEPSLISYISNEDFHCFYSCYLISVSSFIEVKNKFFLILVTNVSFLGEWFWVTKIRIEQIE